MAYESPRQVRRREKLRVLLADGGGAAQVALEVGTPKSHFSAILAGRRGVGDELADKMERYFGKPAGWMDAEDVESSLSPEVAKAAAAIQALPAPERDRVLRLVRQLLELAEESVSKQSAVQQKDRSTSENTDLHQRRSKAA